ncbi:Gfo/Idh/MocA family oxidoreductase [Kribbella solani]|uniref:Gfo/Idh/MocA family protein n=1 Tax=Kribbella solani TaxID=236067 RepID=UPI0029B6E05A|nr:Gfo/Idh/MocA family oxidoreductase [Kribbella solani]MDX2968626.1 Gfo/Idh/MocA family oxidoreductase [Kribbella solani]MDX3006628.1 Gfo/Idh/MocA family oxidoreductase [Kribbella solani]
MTINDGGAMTDRIRVGVIGAGAFGLAHLNAYLEMPGVQVTAVADPDPQRAARALEKAGGASAFADALDLLDADAVDAVSIVSPGPTHARFAAQAAARGVAALVEKPVAVSPAEFGTLRAASSLAPIVPAHLLRFSSPYAGLRQTIRSGQLGEVLAVHAQRHRPRDHQVRFADVGIPLMTTIHDIDLALWLTGEVPTSVVAVAPVGENGKLGASLSAIMELADGRSWSFSSSWLLAGNERCLGDELTVVLQAGILRVRFDGSDEDVLHRALRCELSHFVGCALRGVPSVVVPLEDALVGIALAEAVTTAAVTRTRVPITHEYLTSTI